MFEYIKAQLVELNPTYAIMDNNGLAYFINISLNTYSQLKEGEKTTLFLQQIVREDAHLLFGFAPVLCTTSTPLNPVLDYQ